MELSQKEREGLAGSAKTDQLHMAGRRKEKAKETMKRPLNTQHPTAETTSNRPRVKWPRGTLPGICTRPREMQTAGNGEAETQIAQPSIHCKFSHNRRNPNAG